MNIYREGDTVHHYAHGKGIVKESLTSHSYPIRVKYDNVPNATYAYTRDGRNELNEPPTLSFKPYTLSDGGFDNTPKPKYLKGQILYIRLYQSEEVLIRHFSHMDSDGNVYVFANQKTHGKHICVPFHSPTNPLIKD